MAVLVLAFALFGLRTHRERRVIAQSERLKEDMRFFALAINTYRNEEGGYPPPGDAATRVDAPLPNSLTTPIAYVNRLMTDPFRPAAEGEPILRYLRRGDEITTGSDVLFDAFVRDQIGDPVEDVTYVFWSRGPDGDFDTQNPAGNRIESFRYDPTNGARSNGDLIFWGPAIGVRRNPYLGTSAEGLGPLQ